MFPLLVRHRQYNSAVQQYPLGVAEKLTCRILMYMPVVWLLPQFMLRIFFFFIRYSGHRMSIGWGKPINKLANAVGVETKIEVHDAPPPDVLDPGLPESLQKLTPEAKASLQKVIMTKYFFLLW